uniref:chaperonin GroEL n=1 Tax=Pseudoerythrocladia kornmannii TaxID=753682 RepID=UPI001BEDDB9D|nr:chaperonin GroEL [Pseudoerythrocladia kornmannii]QUE28321.1 GroEL [Pseudoerythrocladia kornmannii]UNJ16825.1 chaperonin GroEL [Pseudoerythrocladia kornmannii]
MAKKILYQDNARQALEKGMDILAEAVAVTLGPKGRNVVLSRKNQSPQIINDGVSIAKEIQLEDHIENTGVALIRQAASKTNDVAGDGTTTATILAHAIVKQGLKSLAAGSNPIAIKRGVEKAAMFVVNQITEFAEPVENLDAIASVGAISAGNDNEIGDMIASAIKRVGREGIISLEEGKSTKTELEITEGMKVDKGFISPYFVTDMQKMEVTLDNPLLLITDKKITLVQQELVPILEKITKTGKPLLIIADDIEKEVLATLIVNKLRNILNVVAIRAPGFGDRRKALLQDIAVLTNGQLITEDLGVNFDQIDISMLGAARSITISKDSTVIIADENKQNVKARCEQLRRQIETSDSNYLKENLQQRLAKLAGGVAIIKVGAATEVEMKDRKLRLEDALNATRAAIEEGIVPGGGSTLTHIAQQLEIWNKQNLSDDELVGANIVAKALTTPLKRIASNAGHNGSVIIEKVENSSKSMGYNASNNCITDMYEAGIIDPAKVTRSAMQNAASISGMFLTTECIVVENIENK